MSVPEDEPPDFPEPDVERATRGWRWIAVPAVVGLVIGAGLGPIYYERAAALHGQDGGGPPLLGMGSPFWAGVVMGAAIGVLLGTVVGALFWAMFPYKGSRHPTDGGEE